uniref:Uncharacterized protein n=1 Tax=Neovison vison TaxID=452646 RepID=A0A8C7A3N5_NEOVI
MLGNPEISCNISTELFREQFLFEKKERKKKRKEERKEKKTKEKERKNKTKQNKNLSPKHHRGHLLILLLPWAVTLELSLLILGKYYQIVVTKNSSNIWGGYVVNWYQQLPGTAPRSIIYANSIQPSGVPQLFSGSKPGTSLTITMLQAEDEAEFYLLTWDNSLSVDTLLQSSGELRQKLIYSTVKMGTHTSSSCLA